MSRSITFAFCVAVIAASAPARAATEQAYADLDARAAKACADASGLKETVTAPAAVRFSDETGVDARLVEGVYPQPYMKGARGRMLCLFDRRENRAETQELPPEWTAAP